MLLAAVWGVQALYVPLNHGPAGGVRLATPLDAYLPILPLWVIPYALTWVIWIVGSVVTAWKMDERLFRSFLVSLLAVIVVGLTLFAIYPTYVLRPVLAGEHWSVEALRYIYSHDGAFNAFPSGHVYLTALFAFYWSRWFPWQRGFWIVTVTVVAASTVLTGQHYLLDPLGGLLLAWLGYHFGLWVMGEGRGSAQPLRTEEIRR